MNGPRRRVVVVGIGSGDPDHLTLGGARALRQADAVFVVDKGEALPELRQVRLDLLERVADGGRRPRLVEVALPPVGRRPPGPHPEAIAAWRQERADPYEALVAGLGDGETGVFLVWGDPSLYDGTLSVLDDVGAAGRVAFDVAVVPGVNSVTALAARHGVALTRPGEAVQVTTGRRVAEEGLPEGVPNVVVLVDAVGAWRHLDDDLLIWWGARVGLPGERLVTGRLGDVRADIDRAAAEVRAEAGWLFDTYLLRRPPS